MHEKVVKSTILRGYVHHALLLINAQRGAVEKKNKTMKDVVYLKNGGIVRGIIVEQVPNVSLKIKTQDKSIFAYRYDEIEKITKENLGDGKKTGLAWLFSFLWTGTGQMYNGQKAKGIIMLISGLLLDTAAIVFYFNYLADRYEEEFLYVSLASFALSKIIWVCSQIDAIVTASKNN